MTDLDIQILLSLNKTETLYEEIQKTIFEELGRSGTNYPYDPRGMLAEGTAYYKLREIALKKGLLEPEKTQNNEGWDYSSCQNE